MRQTAEQLAAALINTRTLPPGLGAIQALSAEARAYQKLNPYPRFHFKDWKTEERGPLPRCLPIVREVVKRGARWLFGKELRLQCPENPTLETYVREAWQKNRMPTRLPAMAKSGGLDGGLVLKFSYDEADEVPVSIQSLSLVDQVRLFYHPHNRSRLLMARVQYPYFDPVDGCTYWYREEWTGAEEVHYAPVKAEALRSGSPDTFEGWQIEERKANPFGLIPLTLIRNLETDDLWGAGDFWDPEDTEGGLFRVLDRVHLTFHLMDKSNQFDSAINPIFIDAEVEDDDIDKPIAPGQPVLIESRETGAGGKAASVVFPPSGNSLRPAMMEYARELKKQVLAAVSSVSVDQAEFTNKGNLTTAVLEQLYQPQIEITHEKRKSYGDGLCEFLSNLARGLQRVGVPLSVTDQEESHRVTLGWPAHFELSEEERTGKTGRINSQVGGGFLTHERAIEEISAMEGRADVETLKDELSEVTAAAAEGLKQRVGPQDTEEPAGAPGKKDE